jgi:hypothetical protein
VNQLFMLAQKSAIRLVRFRLMRNNRHDGSKLSRSHLPDMQIRHDRITVSLNRATNQKIPQLGKDHFRKVRPVAPWSNPVLAPLIEERRVLLTTIILPGLVNCLNTRG